MRRAWARDRDKTKKKNTKQIKRSTFPYPTGTMFWGLITETRGIKQVRFQIECLWKIFSSLWTVCSAHSCQTTFHTYTNTAQSCLKMMGWNLFTFSYIWATLNYAMFGDLGCNNSVTLPVYFNQTNIMVNWIKFKYKSWAEWMIKCWQ